MSHWAWNKAAPEVKRRYFELIRQGWRGAAAAAEVGVSLSCGSVWFVDAGSVRFIEKPISSRYLSQDDRIEISDGWRAGRSPKQIAATIGKSYQTVYREITRNKKPDGTYQPFYAHNQAHVRRRRPRPRRFDADPELARVVADRLDVFWSPAQISRWLRRRYPHRPGWHVCTETIYEAVYQRRVPVDPAGKLRTGRVYRHRRGRGRNRDGALRQCTTMRSIHDRPAIVETRSQAGHWEGDLIIGLGQRSAIATLVERKTRNLMLVGLPDGHSADAVAAAIAPAFAHLPPGMRRTLTWDQGNEMFRHEQIEAASGLTIFFADPHSPWQRPSNENTNGLLRQYFPKGTDLSIHHQTDLDRIAAELNNRPRAVLGDRTPTQLMRQSTRRMKNSPVRNDR